MTTTDCGAAAGNSEEERRAGGGVASELRGRRRAGAQPGFKPGDGQDGVSGVDAHELRARGARVAALVGDLETDNDARRLASSGAPVRQINTHGICHLDAEMIGKHLDGWEGVSWTLDYLFIENVGNLVCPSSYDLGETDSRGAAQRDRRRRQAAQISHHVQLRRCGGHYQDGHCNSVRLRPRAALKNINEIRPGIRIFETSVKSGVGLEEWLGYLQEKRGGM